MNLKINYNECITNLACSIRKYFGLDYKHKTLKYIDDILEEKKPENVVVILFDAMGSRILDRTLSKEDFFIKNKYTDITSVFPTTTAAATTSMLTGLNPNEHGWLGWNTYIEPIDKVISLFLNKEKDKEELCNEFIKIKSDVLVTKDIIDEITEKKIYRAVKLFPFGFDKYDDLEDMLNKIETEARKPGKKFIYAYDEEPDHTMHDLGPNADEVKMLIRERNDKVEKMCDKLTNSLIVILADHGQVVVDNINLTKYEDIYKMLERDILTENRAVSFKVKRGCKKKFASAFKKEFSSYFDLYSKKDIITYKLFGDGKSNVLFESALGDFVAVAINTKKAIITDSEGLYSIHSGLHDDEVYIPLIVVDKCK